MKIFKDVIEISTVVIEQLSHMFKSKKFLKTINEINMKKGYLYLSQEKN